MPGNTLFSIGEALIDMIPSRVGCAFDEVPSFSPRTGGAPANVCAAFTRLGGKSAFLSQLGDDPFGHKIARELEACGIDLSHLAFTDKANTALAFVSLEEDGNRTFSFYRKPSADLLYAPEQIDPTWFTDAFALHFCSVSLVDSPCATPISPPSAPPGKPEPSSASTRTCAFPSGRTARCCARPCCSLCRLQTS